MVAHVPGYEGVRMTTLQRFTYDGSVEITRYNYKSGSVPQLWTMKAAYSFVMHPEKWPEFDITKNNCEHFATRCKTGKKFSLQVEDLFKYAIRHPYKMIRFGLNILWQNFKCK